jgi:hypothetical protein
MLTLRFKGREEKVDMTFKPEDLNQIDLYNLVLVCKDWKKKYEGYLLDFKLWLQARACILNIFIRITYDNQEYEVEDVIFGKREIAGNSYIENKFIGNSISDEYSGQIRDKTDFKGEIAYASKFMSQKYVEIISEAEKRIKHYGAGTGDLIIINCYEEDMIIVSKLYYWDGLRPRKAFFDPCIYPPHFWYRRSAELLGKFYNNEEMTIVPSDYLEYSMKFKTSSDITRWTGYNLNEKTEERYIYEMSSRNTDYEFIIDEICKMEQSESDSENE